MFALSSLLLALPLSTLPEDKPTTIQVRETIQRSIPYIEEKGLWWIERKKCVTCHRVGTMVWSLQAAKQNGFEVSDKLEEWFDWAVNKSLSKNEKGKLIGLGNKEGVAQILLTLKDSETKRNQTDSQNKLADLLREGQQADGSWKPGGQLPFQKRSKPETTSVSTMWLTLTLLAEEKNKKNTPVIERAIQYIKKSPPGLSTEWYVLKLLLAAQSHDKNARDQLIKKIQSQQNSDGGWGWMVGEKSDALGTGMALYASLRAGLNRQNPSVQRAQQFLISTQRKDGSWPVNGTKEKKKDRVEETAVFWGTTWAVIGLIESLPKQAK